MPKYNETSVTGESWIRSNKIICTNEYEQPPTIYYQEEELFNFSDGKVVKQLYGTLNPVVETFTPANANTSFAVIDPETELPTGNTATYQDLYVLVHSLYFHLAAIRDKGPKPFPSWTWNDTTNSWVAPIPKPGDEYTWDETAQAWVILPKPYASWLWNSTTNQWEAPVPKPSDNIYYNWNEGTRSWTEIPNPYPQPYPSWTWSNAANQWIAPVPKPTDGLNYVWNEETQSWVEEIVG